MSYISANQIESITENLLVEADIDTPPVKVGNIAEFICGLEFDWRNLDKYSRGGEVLAAIVIQDEKIYLNESKERELKNNPGRRNFTIAHELGHWFLHKDLAQEKLLGFEGKVIICRGMNIKTDNKERQANLFATYLLMPENFVKTQLNNFTTPLSEYDLRNLADIFQVSKQSMRIRLVDELQLLHYAEGLYYKSKLEALEVGGQQSLF